MGRAKIPVFLTLGQECTVPYVNLCLTPCTSPSQYMYSSTKSYRTEARPDLVNSYVARFAVRGAQALAREMYSGFDS